MVDSTLSQEEAEFVDVPDLKEEDPELIDVNEDDQSDFEACEREPPVEEETFEDEEDEMSMTKVRLHDLNTLKHLYRFGLIRPVDCTLLVCNRYIIDLFAVTTTSYPPSNELNDKISIWYTIFLLSH